MVLLLREVLKDEGLKVASNSDPRAEEEPKYSAGRTAKAMRRRIRSQSSAAPKTKYPKMKPGLLMSSISLPINGFLAVIKKYVTPHQKPNRHVIHETKPNDFQHSKTNR